MVVVVEEEEEEERRYTNYLPNLNFQSKHTAGGGGGWVGGWVKEWPKGGWVGGRMTYTRRKREDVVGTNQSTTPPCHPPTHPRTHPPRERERRESPFTQKKRKFSHVPEVSTYTRTY